MISKDDAKFMIQRLDLSILLKQHLLGFLNSNVPVGEEEMDDLRELCQDKLLECGFDDDYQPTPEGMRLERLIDKLFTG